MHALNWNSLRLFTVVFIEGYTVLALELLAIRQLIPLVGSGADAISIIIAAVLLPLSVGYYQGGLAASRLSAKAIQQKVVRNVLLALSLTGVGFSFMGVQLIFAILAMVGMTQPLVQTALYATCIILPVVYALGQTIPLVSALLPQDVVAKMTGKLLFFSTLGSFAGSVVSTLVVMAYFGLACTLLLIVALLGLMVFLVQPVWRSRQTVAVVFFILVAVGVNYPALERTFHVVHTNQYSTILKVETPDKDANLMIINGSFSAKFPHNGASDEQFPYIRFLNEKILTPLEQTGPKNILVIGAGGFRVGEKSSPHSYTFIDIDPALKKVTEDSFLGKKLLKNKHFVPSPARAFLAQNTQKFDVIVLDAFSDTRAVPPHLITLEFFQSLKSALAEQGLVVMNFLGSATFATPYSRKLDMTFRQVFPYVARQVVTPKADLTALHSTAIQANVMYVAYPVTQIPPRIYTDDLNSSVFDH